MEFRPPAAVIVVFVGEYRDRFGSELICRVLSEHGCKIAPSAYCDDLNHNRQQRRPASTARAPLRE